MYTKNRAYFFIRNSLRTFLAIILSANVAWSSVEASIKDLVHHASFKQAEKYIQTILKNPQLLPADKTIALWWLGICQISEGEKETAQKSFYELLTVAPDYFPPHDISPKIRDTFALAREKFEYDHYTLKDFAPTVIEQRAEDGIASFDFTVGSQVRQFVTEITVYYRTIFHSSYRSFTIATHNQTGDSFSLRIPLGMVNTHQFTYYVEFIGRYRKAFLKLGSALNPFPVEIKNNFPQVTNTEQNLISSSPLKTAWPLLLGACIAVLGSLSYSFLKL